MILLYLQQASCGARCLVATDIVVVSSLRCRCFILYIAGKSASLHVFTCCGAEKYYPDASAASCSANAGSLHCVCASPSYSRTTLLLIRRLR